MVQYSESLIKLVVDLHSKDAIKFGTFTLKSGISSPVYFDLRVIVSYPELMKDVSREIWNVAKENSLPVDCLCGVPYTALPIATVISVDEGLPMLIRRKEAKDYGTKKMLEGHYKQGDRCVIVEDVVTSGTSVLETAVLLEDHGLKVTDALVLLDRQQGGCENLKQNNVNLYSVIGIRGVLEILSSRQLLDETMVAKVIEFIQNNSTVKTLQQQQQQQKPKILSYKQRSELCKNPVSKRLFQIMDIKQTNLILSADVKTTNELLELAELVGPHICMLKTHIDILEDFTVDTITRLQEVSSRLNFIIFEDRKFADIGQTAVGQYSGGLYNIRDWAEVTNVHPVPGSGVIQALNECNGDRERACLIVAEMSSEGNLAKGSYTDAAVQMSKEFGDYVIGFICQKKLCDDPTMLHMSPGVKMESGGDNLGQQYNTPTSMVVERGVDCLIVGRGITSSEKPAETAALYRRAGFEAYLSTMI